jgi:hypothetical protein
MQRLSYNPFEVIKMARPIEYNKEEVLSKASLFSNTIS